MAHPHLGAFNVGEGGGRKAECPCGLSWASMSFIHHKVLVLLLLRCQKGLSMSSTQVNCQGWHVASVPGLLLSDVVLCVVVLIHLL
jgi:hypothetical protein